MSQTTSSDLLLKDPNVTSFLDGTAISGTTYWYRIKSINGDPDSYSNVAEITPEQLYCTTITTEWFCGGDHVYVENVTIGNIDNTSGCDIGGYACYTQFSTDIESSIPLEIQLDGFPMSLAELVDVEYYVDWNEDGDFDDADEQHNLPIELDNDFFWSTTVNVPAGTSPGEKRLRVRAFWASDGDPEPCDNHPDNEAEDYTLNVIDPLPVELLSFIAKNVNGHASLKWTTTNEVNNEGFSILHRQQDGQFEKIGFVEASAKEDQVKTYDFIHRNPGQGRHLYVLEQVDYDGKTERSSIREVVIGNASADITIYPNPAKTEVTLQGLATETESFVSLYSVSGQLIRNILVNSQNPNIDISSVPEGVYIVHMSDSNYHIRKKLVISR